MAIVLDKEAWRKSLGEFEVHYGHLKEIRPKVVNVKVELIVRKIKLE